MHNVCVITIPVEVQQCKHVTVEHPLKAQYDSVSTRIETLKGHLNQIFNFFIMDINLWHIQWDRVRDGLVDEEWRSNRIESLKGHLNQSLDFFMMDINSSLFDIYNETGLGTD